MTITRKQFLMFAAASLAGAAGAKVVSGAEVVREIGKKDGKRKHKGAGGYAHKRTVQSLVERGGQIRSFKLGGNTRAEILPVIKANMDPASTPPYRWRSGLQVHRHGP